MFSLVVGGLMIIMGSEAVNAHAGSRIFPVWELPSADLPALQDGTLEDWETVLPFSSLTHADLRQNRGNVDAADMALRAYLAWNFPRQRLYLGIEFLDDVFLANEFIMVAVDGDHSGGQFSFARDPNLSEAERGRRENSQAQFYQPNFYQGLDPTISWPNPSTAWAAGTPWADVGGALFGEAPAQFLIEFEFSAWDALSPDGPEDSQQSRLIPGSVIGVDFLVFDFDPEDSKGDGVYSPTIYALGESFAFLATASEFADAELVPCEVLDCSHATGTAAVPTSWAMIKAGF